LLNHVGSNINIAGENNTNLINNYDYDLISEISHLRSCLKDKNDILNDKDEFINEFISMLDLYKEECKDLRKEKDELSQMNEVLKACNKQLSEQYKTLEDDYKLCNQELNDNLIKNIDIIDFRINNVNEK